MIGKDEESIAVPIIESTETFISRIRSIQGRRAYSSLNQRGLVGRPGTFTLDLVKSDLNFSEKADV